MNNLGSFGRWDFAEFMAVYEIEKQFDQLINKQCGASMASAAA